MAGGRNNEAHSFVFDLLGNGEYTKKFTFFRSEPVSGMRVRPGRCLRFSYPISRHRGWRYQCGYIKIKLYPPDVRSH